MNSVCINNSDFYNIPFENYFQIPVDFSWTKIMHLWMAVVEAKTMWTCHRLQFHMI